MTPLPHSLYSLTLLLSLISLKLWSQRRHRIPCAYRAGVTRALNGNM